jgi:hypothetical protein
MVFRDIQSQDVLVTLVTLTCLSPARPVDLVDPLTSPRYLLSPEVFTSSTTNQLFLLIHLITPLVLHRRLLLGCCWAATTYSLLDLLL